MSRLHVLNPSQLEPDTTQALAAVAVNGKLPDIYLQFANSEPALRAYLHMEASLREGSLSDSELEAIKLMISQRTGCDFCLSMHTYKAHKAGLSPEQQMAIRTDKPVGEPRIDAILAIARRLARSRGSIPQSMLDNARKEGLSDANLMDIAMAVSTIFFTNIANHINDTTSSMPPAPPLD